MAGFIQQVICFSYLKQNKPCASNLLSHAWAHVKLTPHPQISRLVSHKYFVCLLSDFPFVLTEQFFRLPSCCSFSHLTCSSFFSSFFSLSSSSVWTNAKMPPHPTPVSFPILEMFSSSNCLCPSHPVFFCTCVEFYIFFSPLYPIFSFFPLIISLLNTWLCSDKMNLFLYRHLVFTDKHTKRTIHMLWLYVEEGICSFYFKSIP